MLLLRHVLLLRQELLLLLLLLLLRLELLLVLLLLLPLRGLHALALGLGPGRRWRYARSRGCSGHCVHHARRRNLGLGAREGKRKGCERYSAWQQGNCRARGCPAPTPLGRRPAPQLTLASARRNS